MKTFKLLLLCLLIFVSIATSQNRGIECVDKLYQVWGYPIDAGIRNDTLFELTSSGIQLFDMENPEEPQPIDVYHFINYEFHDMILTDENLYITHIWGLGTVDLSNPPNPEFISLFDSNEPLGLMALDGDLLAVVKDNNQVLILDVGDPNEPEEIASINVGSVINEIQIMDNLVYVGTGRFKIYDIEDPDDIHLVSEVRYSTLDFEIDNGIAYLACDDDGVRILDISNPANPEEINSFTSEDITGSIHARNLGYYEGYLFLCAREIEIVDQFGEQYYVLDMLSINVEELDSPLEATILNGPRYWAPAGYPVMTVVSSYLNVGSTDRYSLEDPARPERLEGIQRPFNPCWWTLLTHQNELYAFSGKGPNGLIRLEIMDLADPAHPHQRYLDYLRYEGDGGICDQPVCYPIAVDDRIYFIKYGTASLQAVDLSDHEPAVLQETIELPMEEIVRGSYRVRDLAHSAGVLFAPNTHMIGNVTNFGITTVFNPFEEDQRIVQNSVDAYLTSLTIEGDYAYATTYSEEEDEGVNIYNISDPEDIEYVSQIILPSRSYSLVVDGDYLYVHSEDIKIYNISEPTEPELAGRIECDGEISALQKEGDYLYVVTAQLRSYGKAIHVINVSDPANPLKVGYYDNPNDGSFFSSSRSFTVNPPYLYCADYFSLGVYDCSGAMGIEDPGNENNLKPTSFGLLSAYPNPFNTTLTVKFGLPSNSPVNISLYNVIGEQLQSIIDSNYLAGTHSATFNGNELSTGIYFIRMETKTSNLIEKVVLIK